MSKLKLSFCLSLFSIALVAGGAQVAVAAKADDANLMKPKISHHDRDSIRKGAELYAEYCLGCHSLEFMRYDRVAQDTGMDSAWIEEELMLGQQGAEHHEPMLSAMSSEDGEAWFGMAPPDLTLLARVQGEAWIYTYLNAFYRDDQAEVGFNNWVQQGSSMPHVLAHLQGTQVPERNSDGEIVGYHLAEGGEGQLSQREYREVTRQLTAFLSYAAEPIRADRERMGIWVLLFLFAMTVIFYFLAKEYFKEVK